MTEIRPGLEWLTITEAAERVHRSTDTIRRWAEEGLITIRLRRIDEHELLLAERTVHDRRRRVALRNLQVNTKTPIICPGGAMPTGNN